MAITASDILLMLSGGTSNSSQNAALGGAASTSTQASASLFDNVSSAEALAGDTEYRCIYVKNNHGSLTAQSVHLWITANTPSSDTDITIGLGTSAVNGTEQTVADENTAPTGVTFSSAANEGAAISIGDLAPGQTKAVWIKRVVNSAASAVSDSANIRVKCDTLP